MTVTSQLAGTFTGLPRAERAPVFPPPCFPGGSTPAAREPGSLAGGQPALPAGQGPDAAEGMPPAPAAAPGLSRGTASPSPSHPRPGEGEALTQPPGGTAHDRVPPGGSSRREWEVVLPPGMRVLSQNDRLHWSQRNSTSQALKDAAVVMCRRARLPKLGQVRVTVAYDPPPDWRDRDPDNIPGASCKPLIDGMRAAGVVPDDNSRHVVSVLLMIGDPHPGGRLRMIITDLGGAA